MYLLSFTTCSFKMFIHGLRWWYSRWVSAWKCRRHRFNPWPGKIPHAEEQLKPMCYSYWTHALEPMSHSFWAWVPGACVPQEKLLQWEAHTWQGRVDPAANREGPGAATKIARNQIRSKKKKKKVHLLKRIKGFPLAVWCLGLPNLTASSPGFHPWSGN